ncbi:hypothetical protein, partial [Lactobacillus sp. W8171]
EADTKVVKGTQVKSTDQDITITVKYTKIPDNNGSNGSSNGSNGSSNGSNGSSDGSNGSSNGSNGSSNGSNGS